MLVDFFPQREVSHASTHFFTSSPSDVAPLAKRQIGRRHRSSPWLASAQRPSTAAQLDSANPTCTCSGVPCRESNALCSRSTTARPCLGHATRTSPLGSRSDSRSFGPAISLGHAAHGADLATLVPPSGSGARAQRPPARQQRDPCPAAA